jgi:hypothetical protein
MIFPYRSVIAEAPGGADYYLLRRPEIPIAIEGPIRSGTYLGLVDTGSDHTILPMAIAQYLGVVVEPESGPPAMVFGGHRVQLAVGEVVFRLQTPDDVIKWTTEVCFFESREQDDDSLILGHSGFLDFFSATFDGKLGALSLDPNDELPIAGK